jgi:cyanophycin synthetase
MISDVWGGEPVAAITLPGDRRDDLVAASAEAIAAWFGRVVIYEDADKRGRAPGEMTDLITAAMRRVRPQIGCIAANGPRPALQTAVAMAAGHPVLFLYEKLAAAADALGAIGARPCPADASPVTPAAETFTDPHTPETAGPAGQGGHTEPPIRGGQADDRRSAGRPTHVRPLSMVNRIVCVKSTYELRKKRV